MLVLKLTLVPALVGLITWAGRRWGPHMAGWLSALPVVAGPVLVFLCAERGAEFARQAAEGTLMGVLAMLAFIASYAWGACRHPWWRLWPLAIGSWALTAWVLTGWSGPWWHAGGGVAVALIAAQRWLPTSTHHHTTASEGVRPSPMEMPTRMVAGASLVWGVTQAAHLLGERVSGMLAVFPVMVSVLVVFTHHQQGGQAARALLRGTLRGWWGFAMFCVVLALTLGQWPAAVAFALALCVALAVAGVLRWHDQRHIQQHP